MGITPPPKRQHQAPKLILQIGVKDSDGQTAIIHFRELNQPIDYFVSAVGSGHIIHLFGTNEAGFDRMFPNWSIAQSLGGAKALEDLVSYAQNKGLLTSHHYNPRIADSNWIKQHPEYADAIVKHEDGTPITEPYKHHPFYVMNPNNELWFTRCLADMQYLHDIGFDYIQLDQFTYQRNFPTPDTALHVGYQKLVDAAAKRGIGVWLEGITDVFRLKPGNFYQILVRDRAQLWPDYENRRGYPYGVSHPEFMMALRPDAEISYQVVTENTITTTFPAKLKTARAIHADLYDLQMDFFDAKYMPLLKTVHE